jgi:hypothetical protein
LTFSFDVRTLSPRSRKSWTTSLIGQVFLASIELDERDVSAN